MLDSALALHAAGISVLPVRQDGSKAPAVAWKPYTTERATVEQLHGWFAGDQHGLGLITGSISGNLELTEIEGRAADRLPDIAELATASGIADLWARLCTGWLERSPSGGLHWFYRVDGDIPGNTKIANGADKITLAETRGTGGFVVVAPTTGAAHETGRPWTVIAGGPATAPTITLEEREAFHGVLAAVLDETPQRTAQAGPVSAMWNAAAPARDGDITPGDDYEARTDWAEILTPHGWHLAHTRGQQRYWCRPGKKTGISASTGHADDRERLYVFTSSTDFDPETPYTKFGAYAHLNHHGDHSAAAAALNALGYGHRAERHLEVVPKPAAPTPAGTSSTPTAVDGNNALALFPADKVNAHQKTLTDVGNALLLVEEKQHLIRYVTRGEWIIWNGHRWELDEPGRIYELAKDVIHDIAYEHDKEIAKHRQRSLSRRGIESMVALARTDPRIVVNAAELDAHPYDLCTPDGIVDLRAGTISPAAPDQLHTKSTAVTPARIPTPRWDTFLRQTFGDDTEMATYVQRLAGYSAMGVVTKHILPFLIGPGGNGKSVFLDVLRAILGDYAATTPAKFLMAGLNQHETEIARLAGLRLVISSEVNQEDKFDEAKVKNLTGGDALTARFMHQNHFTFTPSHTLWLMGNHQPRVTAGGDSFWRRLRLIAFDKTVPDEKRIEGLDKILGDEEGPGILQWVVDGAIAAHADGFAEPDAVLAATNTYAAEEDHLARFAEDSFKIVSDAARVDTSEFRRAYEAWCRAQSEQTLTPQAFGRELRTRFGIGQTRSNGRRYYTGVMLLVPEDEADAPTDWRDR